MGYTMFPRPSCRTLPTTDHRDLLDVISRARGNRQIGAMWGRTLIVRDLHRALGTVAPQMYASKTNRPTLVACALIIWLLFTPVAHAGHVYFVLISRLDNGAPQSLNLNYQEESRLTLASSGQNSGAYSAYNIANNEAGSYICQLGTCEFGGPLKEWGVAKLDESKTHLRFSYSVDGHTFDLIFRRVRLICPSMFPFC